MKLSERLRKLDQPQGAWPVMPDGTPLAREAADLLDKCEVALSADYEWLDRWAEHIGNCRGGSQCTCGLTFRKFEISETLKLLRGDDD